MASSRFHVGYSLRLKRWLSVFARMFNVEFDLRNSLAFRIVLESLDGQTVTMALYTENTYPDKATEGDEGLPGVPATPVAGTLVAGVATVSITNAAGDKLVAVRTASNGTVGAFYEVTRVNNTTVTATSYKDGGGIVQTLDTSEIEVMNLGQT